MVEIVGHSTKEDDGGKWSFCLECLHEWVEVSLDVRQMQHTENTPFSEVNGSVVCTLRVAAAFRSVTHPLHVYPPVYVCQPSACFIYKTEHSQFEPKDSKFLYFLIQKDSTVME